MSKPTKKEIATAIADSKYWRSFGSLLGLTLLGFNDRYDALFYDQKQQYGRSVDIPGWLAERIIALGKGKDTDQ